MLCTFKSSYNDYTKSNLIKSIWQYNCLGKISLTETSLNSNMRSYIEKGWIENSLRKSIIRVTGFWARYCYRWIKSKFKFSILAEIHVKYIFTLSKLYIERNSMMITLMIVNSIFLPFITITLNKHILIFLRLLDIRSDMAPWNLILIILFAEEIFDFGIDVCNTLRPRHLYWNS